MTALGVVLGREPVSKIPLTVGLEKAADPEAVRAGSRCLHARERSARSPAGAYPPRKRNIHPGLVSDGKQKHVASRNISARRAGPAEIDGTSIVKKGTLFRGASRVRLAGLRDPKEWDISGRTTETRITRSGWQRRRLARVPFLWISTRAKNVFGATKFLRM